VTCAILFARNPVPGRVKTRLQPHLSPDQAAALYTAFVRDSVALLRGCGAQRKIVASADVDGLAGLRSLLDPTGEDGLEFVAQEGGDLGMRMEHALGWAFDTGTTRAVILGTDAPSLPPTTIDDALARLAEADVVLGPSVDGGYYLVGVTAQAFEDAAPALFRGIAWSTGSVLAQSVEALTAPLSLALLPAWYDVDGPQQAAFLRSHLEALVRAGHDVGRHSLKALRGLDLPPPS
jgi:rSAM/selenodomain-associated transferase 1